jgi:hypothetical protein
VNRGTEELSALIEESYQWVRATRTPWRNRWTTRRRTAFKNLCTEIEGNIQSLALSSGDVVFIDKLPVGTRPAAVQGKVRRNRQGQLTADSRGIY